MAITRLFAVCFLVAFSKVSCRNEFCRIKNNHTKQLLNLTHGNEGLLNSRVFSPQKSRPCQCQKDKEMLFAIPLKHAVQNTSISIPTPAQVCQFHFHSFYLKTWCGLFFCVCVRFVQITFGYTSKITGEEKKVSFHVIFLDFTVLFGWWWWRLKAFLSVLGTILYQFQQHCTVRLV